MSRHIGIVACSAEGASLCYRTICIEGAQFLGPHAHPEISMHNFPLSMYMDCIYENHWPGVAQLLLTSAKKLADIGADFLICPDNTIHQVFDDVVPKSPLPWLHIAEVVATEAAQKGFKRLALLGTKYLMEGPVYPSRVEEHGIQVSIPEPEERIRINSIIFDELVYGVFKPESLVFFQEVIDRMKNEGCDAAILGCTEIPLLVNPENSSLPTLDSTRLLSRAALLYAVE